ncbi:exonuclease domain-containing protein [Sediminicola luteus]|uniref:exonuclease domain-containing protein n=1 Tax=Sediminicola luteus TaxID=319238 RepID=UPI001FE2C2F9|nr:exonuclease domain-containing protein [Sediminicola luteus]
MIYSIIDIETTGGKYNEEGITDIAIYRFDGQQVVDKLVSLVNPGKPIQPFVVKLTGISDKMVRTAPKFHELAKRIVEITQDSVIVAHNALFDYRILRTEFERLGYPFERESLCTVSLAQELIPDMESYSLGKLAKAIGIPVSDRHRADGDAIVTLKLFQLLLAKDTEKKILTSLIKKDEGPKYEGDLKKIVDELPSETGVYYMYDSHGSLLFLSKSKNIKRSVSQHFSKSDKLSEKLRKQTDKVVFDLSGNELMASIWEQRAYAGQKPKYIPRFRKSSPNYGLFPKVDEDLGAGLELAKLDDRPVDEPTLVFSSFRGAQASLGKLAREYKLQPQWLGLEPEGTNGVLPEILEQVDTPLLSKTLDRFSINGKSFVLLEKGRNTGEKSAFLIENGSLSGFGFVALNHQINQIGILKTVLTQVESNLAYKQIIEAYLRKKRRPKRIEIP